MARHAQDVWPEQTKIGLPLAGSTSELSGYKKGLDDSHTVLEMNVPYVLINLILSYLDERKVPRLHLMNCTHYAQININYLIDQYWNGVL